MKRPIGLAVSLLVLAIAVPAVVNDLGRQFRELERSTREQALLPLVALVDDARRGQDDVAIQRIVHALASTAGIHEAGVLDDAGKFVAHSRSALIGTAWPEESPWGHLVIVPGASLFSAFRNRVVLWVTAIVFLIALAATLAVFLGRDRYCRGQEAFADVSSLAEIREEMIQRLQKNLARTERLCGERLQWALDKIPQSLLLLDENQRVLAVHPQFARWLHLRDVSDIQGKPWQEVPGLAPLGKGLSDSVDALGRTIRIEIPSGPEFTIWSTSIEGYLTTWVSMA